MTQKYLIAFNRSELGESKVIDYYHYVYNEQCAIYDSLSTHQIKKLKEFVEKKIASTDQTPRSLYILDVTANDFDSTINGLHDNGLNSYRCNYLLFNVSDDLQTKKRLSLLNSKLIGNTAFVYLIGSEDCQGNIVDEWKIDELLNNFLLLMTQGAFTHQSGVDPFFWQQNQRSNPNHLIVLNPLLCSSDRSDNIYQKLVTSLKKEFDQWYEETTSETFNFYDTIFTDVTYSEEKNAISIPYHQFTPQLKPKHISAQNVDFIPSMTAELEQYLESLLNLLYDHQLSIINNYKILFHNNINKELKERQDIILQNTLNKFLTDEKFEFRKLLVSVERCINSCKKELNTNYNKIPVFDVSEVLDHFQKKYVPQLHSSSNTLINWISKRNKKRLIINSLFLSSILGFIIFYFTTIRFGFLDLFTGLSVSLLSSLLIIGVISYNYFVYKKHVYKNQFIKKHSESVRFINKIISSGLSLYKKSWFDFTKELYKKKITKKIFHLLIGLQRNLSSVRQVTNEWISKQQVSRSEETTKRTYIYTIRDNNNYDISRQENEMLTSIRKELISLANPTNTDKISFVNNIDKSISSIFFKMFNVALTLNSKNAGVQLDQLKSTELKSIMDKLNINKSDRIPITNSFLTDERKSQPENRHAFVLKRNINDNSSSFFREFDIYSGSMIDDSIAFGYLVNVTDKVLM